MKEKKYCQTCGFLLSKHNTNGVFCGRHIDRTGSKNPFYGKHHSDKTISIIKEKTSVATKKMWQDPEIRHKIISNQTGLKRTDEFKETQRINAIKQYKDIEQHTIRSTTMKNSWATKRIVPNKNSFSTSQMERDFFTDVEKLCPYSIEKKAIHIMGKWFLPDILIHNGIVFEFYGDYWHANPKKYSADDVIHHGIKAKDIWKKDDERVGFLESKGYRVYVFWQDDYVNHRDDTLKKIDILLNWDDCNL